MPASLTHRQRLGHAALLSAVLFPNATLAATVGASQSVEFSPTVVSNFCDITTSGGALAVERKRGLISSDSSLAGSFSGNQMPGSIAVVSNLTSAGTVIVDPPKLSGGTAATTSELKLGNGSYSSTAQSLNLGSDGNLPSTNLNVRFSTTGNGNKFANGTYSAMATVTCTDDASR